MESYSSSNDNIIKEKIIKIEKYLNRVDKSFAFSEQCKNCHESCADIFYNGYQNSLTILDELKNYLDKKENLVINNDCLEIDDLESEKKPNWILEVEKNTENTTI